MALYNNILPGRLEAGQSFRLLGKRKVYIVSGAVLVEGGYVQVFVTDNLNKTTTLLLDLDKTVQRVTPTT